ncbi:MAG: T9SS type A sorting domain-containing protein [Bacteroidia bacterium]|nr:T9SS type A sorting domain-containing protein [Bacteroidia bacterium]
MKSPTLFVLLLFMTISWSQVSSNQFYANSVFVSEKDISRNTSSNLQINHQLAEAIDAGNFFHSYDVDNTEMGEFNRVLNSKTINVNKSYNAFEINNIVNRTAESTNDGKSWLRLSGSMGYSPILIGFVPGATDSYESNYDGEFINEGAPIEFYSYCDLYKLATQGRSELQPYQFVPISLGFQTTSAGNFTISVVLEYIDSNFDIILEDKLKNTFTDLREADYTFDLASATEDNNRFVMHYNFSEVLTNEDFVEVSNSIKHYFSNDELNSVIDFMVLPTSLELFDIGGKVILKTSYKDKIQTKGLSPGIYVVKYGFDQSKTISKKVIKKPCL